MEHIDIPKISQEDIFDLFAPDYDLLLKDWEKDLLEQARVLDYFFENYGQRQINAVLDCFCGIGTQCIGLAKLGYEVTGTDISGKSILRANTEAQRFAVDIEFAKADVLGLSEQISRRFDAVISCDNSLPVLLSKEDLDLALKNMFEVLEPSGLCVISIRNFEEIYAEKKRFNPRHIHEIDGKRLIIFDVWDYLEDEILVFNVFYLREQEQGWDVNCRRMVFRPILQWWRLSASTLARYMGDLMHPFLLIFPVPAQLPPQHWMGIHFVFKEEGEKPSVRRR